MKVKLISILPRKRDEKRIPMPMLGLPIIAGLTPDYIDIEIEEVILDQEYEVDSTIDLVGISAFSATSIFAYTIAQKYREIGKKVVMGGIHVSFLPDEALNFCDSVVIGEGELMWKTVIDDFIEGKLKPQYKASSLCLMDIIPDARLDLLNPDNYFRVAAINATRGCPYDCEFCTVSKFWGRTYRFRPIEKVIEEIKRMRNNGICTNHMFFADDNIASNKEYVKRLLTEFKELNMTWSSQCNLNVANDKELLKLFEESGCIHLYVGIETISSENAVAIKKTMNEVSKYEDQIKKIRDAGIVLQSGLIVGLDGDDEHTFDHILEFVNRTKLDIPGVSVCTPFFGTDLYNRMERENRIISRDWSQYNFQNVVFRPKLMSPELLQNKFDELWTELNANMYQGFLTYESRIRRL